ncbi:UNVERIFIED_CONTAM: hypothetical protein RMT77_007243 [Armadillidium vulgare]|nr:Prenylated Rab acceptor protein 1 [Armadillidium vulgare]
MMLTNNSTKSETTIDVTGNIEIPTSQSGSQSSLTKSFSSAMQLPAGLKLSSPAVREWLSSRREQLKPWTTFGSTSKFSIPRTPQKWTKRVVKNVDYFQSNYMFVSIGLILYCLLTSPLLLVAVAASLGACYIASLKNAERKLVIGGHELTLPQQYIGIGVMSVPIFYLAGATTAIFWVIGASFFVIMLHATIYDIESIVGSEDQPFDLQMEEV